ncbi:hypothetical protein N7490_010170 [Penicillium lividum]|nr:hypothetical protein N7490_010170 [Penicillium lividum]
MYTTETITRPSQPDIQYHPDWVKYQARSRQRKEAESLQTNLPAGFPQKLDSPLVWEGKDIEKRRDWIYQLSDLQLDEIDAALQSFKGTRVDSGLIMALTTVALNKPFGYINESTFSLPTLRPILRDLSTELHKGRGFFVLRGLRIDDHSQEDNVIIYTGVSSHIGSIRGRQQDTRLQNGTSPVISHIKDITGITEKGKIGAPSNTADKQVFHTDAGDIISLLCLSPAAEAGESYLSSSWNVYNILAKERPDLIHTLSQDWPVDGFGNPQKPYTLRPLLYHQPATETTPQRVLIQYARRYFTGFLAQSRSAGIPPITEAQAEALDALHFLAEEHRAVLDFQKGDVQYVNNLSIFHARNSFTDAPGKESVSPLMMSDVLANDNRRHLLRLWLRDPENAWKTPEPLKDRWDAVFQDVTEEEQAFPLEAGGLRKTLGS